MPSCAAIWGNSGPKEKNAAFPLPINMAAQNMMKAKTAAIVIPESPMWLE